MAVAAHSLEPASPFAGAARFRPMIGVVAWLALVVAANADWLQRQLLQFPPPWDPAFYLYLSARYRNLLADGGPLAIWPEFTSAPLPSILPLTTVPLYVVLGTSRLVAHLTTSAYLVVMVLATYGLARRLRDESSAGLAAFLLATFTAVIHLSRDYLGDFPFAALLTATVYALARSEDLQRRGWSVAAGVAIGLTLLSRIMAPALLVGPLAVVLVRAWRRPPRERAMRNAALAGLAAAALASVWWARHLTDALRYVAFYGFGPGAAPYDPTHGLLSLKDLTFYLLAIANDGMSLPLAALFAMAVIFRYTSRGPAIESPGAASGDEDRRAAVRQLLAVWFGVGYAALTLSRNKAPDRYTVALLPPVAIAMAAALLDLPRRRRRRVAVAAALVLGAYNWTSLTWPSRWAPQLSYEPPGFLGAFVPQQTWLRSTVELSGDWPIEEVLDALSDLSRERLRRAPRLAEATVSDLLDADVSAEDCVRRSYRRLLKRDPEPEALAAYVFKLETGALSRRGLLFGLAGSRESLDRPLRVLVAADHPFFNFNTLRYYVESERREVTLAALPDPPAVPDLVDYDAVALLIPGHPTHWPVRMGPIETALRAHPGFRPLRHVFPEADGWLIGLFVATGLDGTAPVYRGPIECGRWDAGGHFGRGWSWPEETFRWTDGPEAEIFFDVDRPGARILRMAMASFRSARPDGVRDVEVWLNGQPLTRWTLTGTAPVVRTAVLPNPRVRRRNQVRLRLPPPGPVVAADGTDSRALGLAVSSIRVDDFPPWPRDRVSWSSAGATAFLGDGWSWAEAGYRWTEGSGAEVLFGAPGTLSTLRLRLQPFVAPAWPGQRVALSLNGREVVAWMLAHPEPRDYAVALPAEALGPANVLRLDTPDARAPADVGAGADTRSLGVAVHWMQVER